MRLNFRLNSGLLLPFAISLSCCLFSTLLLAQSEPMPYSGKIVKGSEACEWLILIESGPETSMLGKLIAPSGNLPEILQRRRMKVRFDFIPLRQPVSPGCEAHFVGSIPRIEKRSNNR